MAIAAGFGFARVDTGAAFSACNEAQLRVGRRCGGDNGCPDQSNRDYAYRAITQHLPDRKLRGPFAMGDAGRQGAAAAKRAIYLYRQPTAFEVFLPSHTR